MKYFQTNDKDFILQAVNRWIVDVEKDVKNFEQDKDRIPENLYKLVMENYTNMLKTYERLEELFEMNVLFANDDEFDKIVLIMEE